MPHITFRTSSLHGTGDEALKRQHVKARQAIQAAIDAVREITVHGRDYLADGVGDFSNSRDEYRVLFQALTHASNFIQAHELALRGFDKDTVQGLAEDLHAIN